MNNLLKAMLVAVIFAGIVIAWTLITEEKDDAFPVHTPLSAVEDAQLGPEATEAPITPRELTTFKVTGVVKSEDGLPISGAQVSGFIIASGRESTRTPSVNTSEQGTFTLTDLKPGPYRFIARAGGYQEARLEQTLIEGQEPEPLNFTLSSGLTISGYVRDYLNKPVAKARLICLLERVKRNAPIEEQIKVLIDLQQIQHDAGIRTTTDSEGWYQLTGLDPALYRVTATRASFAPGELRYVQAGSSNANFNLNLGGTLRGQVVSHSGTPVSGATVEAYRGTEGGVSQASIIGTVLLHTLPPVATTEANSSGNFTFTELGGGTEVSQYRVRVWAPRYQTKEFLKVVVNSGDNAELIVELESGQVIAGTVFGPDNTPLAGARVKVNLQGARQGRPTELFNDGILTNEDGELLYDTLEDGQYRVVASHEDYASYQQNKIKPDGSELVITLTEGAAISGRVFDATSSEPMAGAEVVVRDLADVEKKAISASDGIYYVGGITEPRRGEASLTVQADGYKRVSNVRVAIRDGRVTEGQDFHLERNGSISGTVVLSDGSPLPNCTVSVMRQHSAKVPYRVSIGQPIVSDKNGHFTVPQVAPGEENFLQGSHPIYLTSFSEPFDLESGQSLTGLSLMMKVGGSLAGIVVDEDRQPIEGATIAVKDDRIGEVDIENFPTKVTSGAQGSFRISSLEEGQHILLVGKSGYLDTELSGITVVEGRTTDHIDVVLVKGSTLSGQVTNSSGDPIVRATVMVIDTSDGLRKEKTTTDSNGVYSFENLGSFPVDVEANANKYTRMRIYSQAVNSTGVDFQLQKLGGVRGYAYDESTGKPLNAFTVSPKKIMHDKELKVRRPKTFQRPDGRYEFDDLEPGNYNIYIACPGYTHQTLENIIVPPNEIVEMPRVNLREGGKVAGVVVDGVTGEPVSRAKIEVTGGSGVFIPAMRGGERRRVSSRRIEYSDNEGRFEIRGLAKERVDLRVEHRDFMRSFFSDLPAGDMGLRLELTQGGSIEGRIIGPDRDGLSGVQVLLAGTKSDRGTTNRKGFFRFSGLSDGHYKVILSQIFRSPKSVRVPPLDRAPTYEVDIVGAARENLGEILYNAKN